MQNRFSPLRYPGGKGRLTDFLVSIYRHNNIFDGHYVEPYAGGGAIALGLLFRECVQQIHINDLDRSIYAFWHSVLRDAPELCKRIADTPVNVSEWRRQRSIQQAKKNASLLDLGFSTFYLNRTNRSGIITGGMIGGFEQNGTWSIDARFNKKELINRIEKIAEFADRISIYNLDAQDFLERLCPRLPERSLVYLDPPYFNQGRRLYHSHYRPDDHHLLANWIQDNLRCRWMITYDKVPEIVSLYPNRRKYDFSIGYSVSRVYSGSEIMIFSDDLEIPHPIAA